jgi:hypothetical protein
MYPPSVQFLNGIQRIFQLRGGMQSLLTKERPELGLVKFIYVERYTSTALDFPHF